jgi:transcriptional regulator of acetoin/glycerol metabolism
VGDLCADAVLTLAAVEERQIRRVLAMGLPLVDCARLLGIDGSTLWRKRKQYGLLALVFIVSLWGRPSL